ncbi:MAG: thiamine pyrophosphate-dependent enzyme [Actinomycetota bacterium]
MTNTLGDSSTSLTGGQAMARQLAVEGVTHIFGIPGVQLDYASNGLSGVTDQIRFINVRHEQSTTYAADGYFRSTGRTGVALVVPGPGVLNAGAGLVTALSCSSSILLISGQIPSRGIGKGLGLLHEIPDQSGILATLCRENTLVTEPEQVAGALHGALVALGSGPGPISVEIPPDVLAKATSGPAIGAEPPATPSPGSDAELGAVAERLQAAARPVIYAGGGAAAAGAWDELTALADAIGAPLVSSTNGKGAVNSTHPLSFLPLDAKELLFRADVVLMVGSRGLDNRGQPLAVGPDTVCLALNTDPAVFGPPRSYVATARGDARTGAAALAALLGGRDGTRAPWLDDADDVRARAAGELAPLEPQMAYAAALRAGTPDDTVLVNELTQVGYVARYTYPLRHPRSYLDPGYQGTLGYGYPTAIGAAVGNPDRPVVSVNGDGGFGYGLAELATVVNHDIPLVAVVFRDDAYGNVQRMHRQQFDGVHHGTELTNPDMLGLAAAFGVRGYQATSPDDLSASLSQAIDAREPALIDVPMGRVPDPWSIVMRPWRGS